MRITRRANRITARRYYGDRSSCDSAANVDAARDRLRSDGSPEEVLSENCRIYVVSQKMAIRRGSSALDTLESLRKTKRIGTADRDIGL